MVTKQRLQQKIENLTEEQLNQVYDLVENLSSSGTQLKKPSLMSELQKISIDAPEYLSMQVAMKLGRDVSEK